MYLEMYCRSQKECLSHYEGLRFGQMAKQAKNNVKYTKHHCVFLQAVKTTS